MDWHELHKMRVIDLRELAKEKIPEITGVTSMKKDDLCEHLAQAMGIEKPHLVVTGLDKTAVKSRIRELRVVREEAKASGDRKALVTTRKEIHRLKRTLRKAARLA